MLTCLANSGRRWLPIRCSLKPLEHPNRLSRLHLRPPALFREAHFWITSNMVCFMLDEDNSAFDYSTVLSRGANRRRTGGPRPSDVLCQYRLLYQVLYRLSASGASASGARFIRDYISRLSYRLFATVAGKKYPSPAIVSPEKGSEEPCIDMPHAVCRMLQPTFCVFPAC